VPSHLEARIEQQPDVPLPAPVFETTAPEPSGASAPAPQAAVVDALAAARQTTAADALADATWTIASNQATVQTTLSAAMISVVMNPDADRIARAALRDLGILTLTLLSGAAAPSAAKKPRSPRTGSAEARALEHPVVQQAQRLFNAELRSVIDLRDES
jgi:DNA polymerase-3 subunit gamma/tau